MDQAAPEVTVYWRPGCLFCAALLSGLRRAGIAHQRTNIWEDPDAAARVRSLTGGDETVPTVVIGNVALINPTVRDVRRQLDASAPTGLAGRLARWRRRRDTADGTGRR